MDNPVAKIDSEAAQVRKDIADLRSQISAKEERLAALAAARDVLVGLGYEEESRSPAVASPAIPSYSNMKTKDLILEALSKGRLWQTANEVQDTISEWAGRQIPMSTVSPYLSEMKRDGAVARKGMSVAATLRVEIEEPSFLEENGEAEASPDEDEVATSSYPNPASRGA